MSTLAIGLLSVGALFSLLLIFKQLQSVVTFCAICVAVTLTWLTLLSLAWLDMFNDTVLVALFVGHTSLGVYYLAERRASRELLIFRLPFLATLLLTAYSLLSLRIHIDAVVIAAVMWLTTGALYALRTTPHLRNKAKALIECCSNW